ncbi:MAG: CDP-glycerol glycerophosphotransferase family protein, partial [Patescibacteria group bacterium]
MGDAKFDDWFNGNLDKSFIGQVMGRIDPTKKTVLYMPTHSDLSSAAALKNALGDVSGKYNVIIKFHHLTVYEDEDLIADYSRNKNFIIFDDTVDSLSLFSVCDAVLSDNSSAVLEALLLRKPVVAGDFFGKEYFDTHGEKFFYKNYPRWPVTYYESVEQIA